MPTPGAALAAFCFDPQGTPWLQHSAPDPLGRVRPDLRAEELPIPTARALVRRIVAGPGGGVWCTEPARDTVERLSVSGLP